MKENRRCFMKGALYGALVAIVMTLIVVVVVIQNSAIDFSASMKLNSIEDLVEETFIYDVDKQLQEQFIYKAYMAGLEDPYSKYYTPEEAASYLEAAKGIYSGIGIVIGVKDSTGEILVQDVYEDTPASRAKIKAGDIIIKVDGIDVVGKTIDEVVKYTKKAVGADVILSIISQDKTEREVKLVCEEISIVTVTSEMKKGNVGYINVDEFDDVTYEQFNKALIQLESQGMQSLVIDLRDNPGGSLQVVCDMLRLLLPEGLIVYTEDKDGKRVEKLCDGKQLFEKPLAVLVNQNSASASEIFTGAIQDYGIGTIVGTKTYGKGIVQDLIRLRDGSMIKMTSSQYFTPKGRNIHKKGIEPDITVENNEDGKKDLQLETAIKVVSN